MHFRRGALLAVELLGPACMQRASYSVLRADALYLLRWRRGSLLWLSCAAANARLLLKLRRRGGVD